MTIYTEVQKDVLFTAQEVTLVRRYTLEKELRTSIKTASQARVYMLPFIGNDISTRERFYCLFLNNANEVICVYNLSTGGVASTLVDIKLFAAAAALSMATSIILAHNHPSGQAAPSSADFSITEKLKAAAQSLDMQVIDHILITEDDYYSFSENGHL